MLLQCMKELEKKSNKRVNSTQPTFQQLFVQMERAEFEATILKKNDQLHIYCSVVVFPTSNFHSYKHINRKMSKTTKEVFEILIDVVVKQS